MDTTQSSHSHTTVKSLPQPHATPTGRPCHHVTRYSSGVGCTWTRGRTQFSVNHSPCACVWRRRRNKVLYYVSEVRSQMVQVSPLHTSALYNL